MTDITDQVRQAEQLIRYYPKQLEEHIGTWYMQKYLIQIVNAYEQVKAQECAKRFVPSLQWQQKIQKEQQK